MSFCTVFANINDDELPEWIESDLFGIISYMVKNNGMRTFFLTPNRKFEEQCKSVIKTVGACLNTDIYILDNVEPNTYDIFLGNEIINPNEHIGDYLICDKTTKNIGVSYMNVDYIIEKPRTQICLLIKSHMIV